MSGKIFISHATADDGFVKRLRDALEGANLPVWVDSREITGGDELPADIKKAIEEARAVLVVLSQSTVNSSWVRTEVQLALAVQKQQGDSVYKVIPVLLPGIEPAALWPWFDKEPLAIKITVGPGGIEQALPELRAALGEQLPVDLQPPKVREAAPVADLTLELTHLKVETVQPGARRAVAETRLVFYPPQPGAPSIMSRPFRFVAPLGGIEADELTWYIERYSQWPVGSVIADRARELERDLETWGQALFKEAIGQKQEGRDAFDAWRSAGEGVDRRFSVLVDDNMLAEATDDQAEQARAAATSLLALPWELIHDGSDFLFAGGRGARVRRRLPNMQPKPPIESSPPLRVLLLSPRPEEDRVPYIDHRVSARPLVEALTPLGELAELSILNPPTFKALSAELDRAEKSGRPYHVVHFDGHGVFDRARRDGPGGRRGLGALVFEHPDDVRKTFTRRSETVDCKTLSGLIKDRRVPLFFLGSCLAVHAETDPTSSVAGTLLQGGAASVAAMSQSILVETERRFVGPFYKALLEGKRVGQAMLAGQKALHDDSNRGHGFGGDLKLQDWFVPVLFQEETDPQLVRQVRVAVVQEEIQKQRRLPVGKMPETPPHSFVGRSRELLAAERLLLGPVQDGQRHFVVLRGGGEGKTALACELARWLVASRRFQRAAFASLENSAGARSLLRTIGEQLVPRFADDVGADEKREWQLVERALGDHLTLLVIDNVESILPPYGWAAGAGGEEPAGFDPNLLQKILELCRKLVETGGTSLVFTSRSPLSVPFDDRGRELDVGRLSKSEALELVGKVLGEGGRIAGTGTDLESQEKVEELVEVLGGHARSLVLIAQELLRDKRRLNDTTADIRQIMADLHRRFPNDREQSLFASVELSLRKLPPDLRAKLPPLGVFHGGGCDRTIAKALGLDLEQGEFQALARALSDVGLAELLEYNYLRFDPALGPFLLRELDDSARAAAEARWADATAQLTRLLYGQQRSDPQMVAALSLHELPNLLSALEWRSQPAAGGAIGVESVIDQASRLEPLLQKLGRPRALERAVAVRERAAAALKNSAWSHAHYLAGSTTIDRLMDSGRAADAVLLARPLLAEATAAGETAYEGAGYDLAMCHACLGRALVQSGEAQAALGPLDVALTRLQSLADAGDSNASSMTSVCLIDRANALLDLGRLEDASTLYEKAIKLAVLRGDPSVAAVGRARLGMVRFDQGRYGEALQAYEESRQTSERLGESASVAAAWHQMGMVYLGAGQYDKAETAYLNSRRINVELGDRPAEADTLGELGRLYGDTGRLEDAVRLYREAATIYADPAVRDLLNEGHAHNNVADSLRQLGRLDEARREVERAIDCNQPFGHVAESWATFGILTSIEQDAGRPEASFEARRRAIEAYLAYRRDGGYPSRGITGRLCEGLLVAVKEGRPAEFASGLDQLDGRSDKAAYLSPVLVALRAVLAGSRDPALADDPALDYDDAAEILLLLERLRASQQVP